MLTEAEVKEIHALAESVTQANSCGVRVRAGGNWTTTYLNTGQSLSPPHTPPGQPIL